MKKVFIFTLVCSLILGCSTVPTDKARCEMTTVWDPVRKVEVKKCVPVSSEGVDPSVGNFISIIGLAILMGIIFKTAPKEAYN